MYENLIQILKTLDISYEEIVHEETTSCEHSAILREKAWLEWIWSKNIVFHAKWNYYLVTTIWIKDIKARIFKKEFQTKDIRFANQEEISQLKLWTIWSIPPFWFENENINIYVDKEIFSNEYFMFNPFLKNKTIRIKSQDLLKIYNYLNNKVQIFSLNENNELILELIQNYE